MKRMIPAILIAAFFAFALTPVKCSAGAEVSVPKTVKIVMVGDILLHSRVEEAAMDANGNYNFDFIFANMKSEIAAADIAIVNEEVILGGKELGISGYPSFNAPWEVGDALINAGFDVVCHATNHALDKGKNGITNTLSYWEKHPEITVVGINKSAQEREAVTIIEKNGIRIAILNYTYGTNGISMPKDMPYAVNLLDADKVKKDLAFAEANADFTIVCPHWGTEYNLGIDASQKKWTKIFREGGADLVIGTHPHVLEPAEFLQDDIPGISNNHGNGDMLVYYSLGNFVNWTSGTGEGTTNRMVGGMAKINISMSSAKETAISGYGIEPVVCHVSSGYKGVTVYPLSAYTEELAAQNEIKKQDGSFSREKCEELCKKINLLQ